ncbi:phosphoribosylaminoimidazolesuccinocarboxamide synthase [Granulicella sp. 5B5]|uniref:phosphoribosylaminoimidazolesuccinocarboxamide synthase n=1 Tax=Granulicella sp. 5B5 TaxID=1617967 RepID=UPI0015F5ABD2|nr:phosphoribosylaminoimidazolesuccinocarboxamide synthase [Granulicella sp. 5B5]
MTRQELISAIPHCLQGTALESVITSTRYSGKVRDTYDLGDGRLLLITTDRQSGFDRMLGLVPYKGQVLNRTSLYWFDQTRHIVKNHVISSPHANALLARKCKVLPIEFVVRGYMTGSTDTSIWTQYQGGARTYCGHLLPEGIHKNQKLPENIVTPTTKESKHDRPISAQEVIHEGWLTAEQWEIASSTALKLFSYGQWFAATRGLILADTKYEFGIDEAGEVTLIDEVHTPDSSRYWLYDSYEERMLLGKEPEMIDKEFFRLWFRERCDPYNDAELPKPSDELIADLSSRYIRLFEMITGATFVPDPRPLESIVLQEVSKLR